MLHYTIALFVIALFAKFFDFDGIAKGAVVAAGLLLFIFMVLTLTGFLFRSMNKAYPRSPRLPHFMLALTNPPFPTFFSLRGNPLFNRKKPDTAATATPSSRQDASVKSNLNQGETPPSKTVQSPTTTPFKGLIDNLLRPLIFGPHALASDYVVLISTLIGILVLGLNLMVLWPVMVSMVQHTYQPG
jgi:uncharacterized membrane protein YtjA (UPF0391 family)